jgi:hypothetical protein
MLHKGSKNRALSSTFGHLESPQLRFSLFLVATSRNTHMDRRRIEAYDWLAAQVEAQLQNGAVVESGAVLQGFRN